MEAVRRFCSFDGNPHLAKGVVSRLASQGCESRRFHGLQESLTMREGHFTTTASQVVDDYQRFVGCRNRHAQVHVASASGSACVCFDALVHSHWLEIAVLSQSVPRLLIELWSGLEWSSDGNAPGVK